MAMGGVVARGYTFDITDLKILKGDLVITAVGTGPMPNLTGELVTVFGADGVGFAQGAEMKMSCAAKRGWRVSIEVRLRMVEILDS